MDITSADVQNTLMEFHENGFAPPKSLIALPTRGVLGEAVLGNCPSAEKIDLTRFWNWQDSPSDSAPIISDVTLPTEKQTTQSLQAPSALTGVAPLINNINANPTAPGGDGTLLTALAQAAAQQRGFDVASLTNAEALSELILGNQRRAGEARHDALETTKQLSAQAMATIGNILGGVYGNNKNAGASAASAVYGTEGSGSSDSEDSGDSGNSGSSGESGGSGGESGGSGGGDA